jgi:hypothetical protein
MASNRNQDNLEMTTKLQSIEDRLAAIQEQLAHYSKG